MDKKEETLKILNLIAKKYVLPLNLYDTDCVKEVLGKTFIYQEKPTPIVDSYIIGLDSILVTNLNPNFKIEEYTD